MWHPNEQDYFELIMKSNFRLFTSGTVHLRIWHTPKNEARVTMVSGLGTVDVIILEVSHFNKAILDRGWMVALDLCRKEKKKNDSNTPSITLGHPPSAPVILCKGQSINDVGTFFPQYFDNPSPCQHAFLLLSVGKIQWNLTPPSPYKLTTSFIDDPFRQCVYWLLFQFLMESIK